MDLTELAQPLAEAAAEFNRHENRGDGEHVAGSLAKGLTLLRDTLFVRTHYDVERRLGMDSMLVPSSWEKTERSAKVEIEVYQAIVAAATARERGYTTTADSWFLAWLTRFRLGRLHNDPKLLARQAAYLSKSGDALGRAFAGVLARVLKESARAPLVLFRLHPLAVSIVTAQVFGDAAGTGEYRNRQEMELPRIRGCRECHGKVLENGAACRSCGNPLWKSDWLESDD